MGNLAQSLVNFRGPLIREMIRRGHEVIAVAPEGEQRYTDALHSLGAVYRPISFERTTTNPVDSLRFMVALWRLLAEEKPNVFLGYTIKPVVFGALAAQLAGVSKRSVLITGLGYAFGTGSWRQRILGKSLRGLYRLALARTHVVFFQNPDDLSEFVRLRFVDENRAQLVAGSGVDLQRFPPSRPPTAGPVFLLIARLIREKGIVQFVTAAQALKAGHPTARFQILGPFDANPTAISEKEVNEWQEQGIIEYLGETDDVRPFLKDSSVFVLPSYYREGTPRTALEALATGRAIITTDSPGCRETVVDSLNGFLVQPRDAEALQAAMERMIEQPDLIARMGTASLELARSKYDVNLVNSTMLNRLGL